MVEISIQEEKITEKFLDELGHYLRLIGKINSVFYISVDNEEDYVEQTKMFLKDFLIAQDKNPIYLTFITYDDNTDDFITLFNKNKIQFTLNLLEEKRSYYTLFKKHQYQPPCFTAKITDSQSLTLIINETFWLPAQNEFYAISNDDNLVFKVEKVSEWGRKRERSIPIFNIEEDSTFITIFYDGEGFYLFSNEDKYSTVEHLSANLPKGTVIAQENE